MGGRGQRLADILWLTEAAAGQKSWLTSYGNAPLLGHTAAPTAVLTMVMFGAETSQTHKNSNGGPKPNVHTIRVASSASSYSWTPTLRFAFIERARPGMAASSLGGRATNGKLTRSVNHRRHRSPVSGTVGQQRAGISSRLEPPQAPLRQRCAVL